MTDYRRMELRDGQLVEVEAVSIPQSQLTADCFEVQFRGLKACESCAYHNTVNCGGGKSLWALILAEHGGPPAAYWAVDEADDGVTAKALGSGKIGTFGFTLRRLWLKHCRGVKDAREGMAAAEAEGAELSEDEVEALRRKVGHSAMVAGFRSNTFGGVYEKDGRLYILSLNTRTFRLSHDYGDWRGQGEKARWLPWMTETSAAALRVGLRESADYGAKWSQRHLRFYWGETNAPVEKAREWALAEGYEEVI